MKAFIYVSFVLVSPLIAVLLGVALVVVSVPLAVIIVANAHQATRRVAPHPSKIINN